MLLQSWHKIVTVELVQFRTQPKVNFAPMYGTSISKLADIAASKLECLIEATAQVFPREVLLDRRLMQIDGDMQESTRGLCARGDCG